MELFNRKDFETNVLETAYSDPLKLTQMDLCHLFLVLAIGLVLAIPYNNTEDEAKLIEKLQSDKIDRAEFSFGQ